jgi:hypothetical protein
MKDTKSKQTLSVCSDQILVRRGFGVELTRDDGTTVLALTGGGILPFVHVHRKWAVNYKRKMQEWGFKARVVPVTFTDPAPNDKIHP